MNAEEGGSESGGSVVDCISVVCGNADAQVVVVSENCVHRTVIQMGSDGVAVVENARRSDDFDAEGKFGLAE